jgi:tetratricopeptide (TPR) repeat protein
MKIFQKILSHGLLIAFFVAVFFIYLYRVELFPQWFAEQAQRDELTPPQTAHEPAAVAGAQQAPPGQAGVDVTGAGGESAQTPSAPQAGTAEPAQPAPQPAAAAEQAAKPPSGETADDQFRPVKPSEADRETYHPVAPRTEKTGEDQFRPVEPEEVAKETYHPVTAVPASVTSAPAYRPLEVEKAVPPDVAAQSVESVSEADFRSRLERARQHYWRRDLAAAEQIYKQLTESHPERAEVWGELGNLYFGQKEMVQATDAYYRAIDLMIEQGDAARARQLLGAMQQLDADKASELETRLRQAGG